MTDRLIQIGNVTLETPFVMAPLAGITDAVTRRLCAVNKKSPIDCCIFAINRRFSCFGKFFWSRDCIH